MNITRKHRRTVTTAALAIALMGAATARATPSDNLPFVDEIVHIEKVGLTPTDQASNLIGSDLYTADDEKIGDVDDLILDADHKVVAMTVGVGGFLGIDETYVAVPLKHVTFGQDEDGDEVRLATDLTKADIERAAHEQM